MNGLAQRQADLQPGNATDYSGNGVQAYLTVVMVLSVLAVVLRFWSRGMRVGDRSRQFYWWDDWMALISLASCPSSGALSRLSVTLE